MKLKRMYGCFVLFALSLIVAGFLFSPPDQVFRGLLTIITSEATLITDYVAIAGPGAAFVNAGLVALVSIVLLYLSENHDCAILILDVGITAGFALFGKNIVNIWPIFLGTFLYAKYQKEKLKRYVPVALLGTALAPIVSFIALREGPTLMHLALALLAGVFIGFVLPPLADHTFNMQNGMNLYNMGFAAGLLALVMVSLVRAFGNAPEAAYYWSTEHWRPLLIYFLLLALALVIAAFAMDRRVLKQYKRLVLSRGRAPNNYVDKFGVAPVLLNLAVTGGMGVACVFAVGGDLNGPTLGAVFTIMCFAANGKNPRNISAIMLGIIVGSLCNSSSLTTPAVQIACLFGTALAPIADVYGWPAGLLAGFLHASVVLYAGSPLAGLNLYNNGFCAGIVTLTLCPILSRVMMHRDAGFSHEDYTDLFK